MTVECDADGTEGLDDVDAFEGVFWVDVDWVVFFEPLVYVLECLLVRCVVASRKDSARRR